MEKKWLMLLTLAVMTFTIHAQQDTVRGKDRSNRDTVIRLLPSPLPSPPFPTADWDGGPLIGTEGNKFKVYGWVDVGGNLSTSKHSNAPTSYDLIPYAVVLDQVGIKFDKQPNT